MKSARILLAALLVGFILPGIVLAQQTYVVPDAQQSAPAMQQTGFEANGYAYAPAPPSPSPSDAAPAAVAETEPAPVYYRQQRAPRLCRNGIAGRPLDPVSPTTVVSRSADGPRPASTAMLTAPATTARWPSATCPDMTVDQLWVFAERVADTSKKSIDWGFRIDYVWGARRSRHPGIRWQPQRLGQRLGTRRPTTARQSRSSTASWPSASSRPSLATSTR